MKRWLITGGCGFIGTSLIKHLTNTQEDYSIRVLDNLHVGTRNDLENVVEFTEIELVDAISPPQVNSCQLMVGDIRDMDVVLKAVKDIDIVVHLAANTGVPASVSDPRLDMESNVIGVFNVLDAARQEKIERFVFASSGAPAGEVEPPIHEELPPHPVSPYGASKLAGEGYCSSYFRTFGVETVALRFGNVYGPGSTHKSSVIAKFIKQALNGDSLEVYGDGSQTRDFIYIADLIDAIIKASSTPGIGGETFQIATSQETTINEMLDKMILALQALNIPLPAVSYTEQRLGDVKRNYSDTTKARNLMGWSSNVELKDGLVRTLKYFINQ